MQRARGRFGKRAATVLAVVLGFLVGEASSSATMIGGTDFNIEYWAGSGPKQAVLVIDFGATGGNSYSFGYRWDGTAHGYDMIQAIATEAVEIPDFGAGFDMGHAVAETRGLGYSYHNFGTKTVPDYYIVNFWYGSEEGNGVWLYWWQYFIGTPSDGSVTWTSSSVGPSTRVLTDGSIDGWYNSYGFYDDHVPRVPEPASALMLAAATALLHRRAVREEYANPCAEPTT